MPNFPVTGRPNSAGPSRRDLVTIRAAERIQALGQALAETLPRGAITLEIGCGHGHFLAGYATHHPEINCVGIDLSKDRIARANRKAKRLGNKHLCFLLAEAGEFLAALPKATKLREIFVLFPDPWPKRRHHKNRLIQSPFLAALAQRCEAGARLYFRTDFEPYFSSARKTISDHSAWQVIDAAWPFETETVFQARATSFRSLIATLP